MAETKQVIVATFVLFFVSASLRMAKGDVALDRRAEITQSKCFHHSLDPRCLPVRNDLCKTDIGRATATQQSTVERRTHRPNGSAKVPRSPSLETPPCCHHAHMVFMAHVETADANRVDLSR